MKFVAVAALLSAAGLASPALAVDFTGPVAPGNWTVATLGTLTGASATPGSATFSSTQLALVGGNSLSPPPGGETPSCLGGVYQVLGPCQVQATIGLAGVYKFNWSYLTADGAGPGGDIFGVIVDSTRIALSDPGGALAQSGSASFTAGSSFGWFINCTDCIGGSASTTVSSVAFTQAIPEPSTYALLSAGLAWLGLVVQRKRKSARLFVYQIHDSSRLKR